MAAPRLLLDSAAAISTQRLTWGSLSTVCASLRAFEAAFAEAEGARVAEGEVAADELFFGSFEFDGVAFAEALANALPVATFFGAAVVAPLGDLAGVALGFAAVDDALDDGDALGLADALADGDALGVADAVGDGDELGVEDELGVVDVAADSEELDDADALGDTDELGDGDELGVAEELGAAVCLTLPPPLRANVVPALTLVLALAGEVGVEVSDGVEVGVSDGVVGGGGAGVLGGALEEPVFVGVGVGVGVVDVPAAVPVAVGVGVAVGGGVDGLTGSHDWLLVAAAASSSATT